MTDVDAPNPFFGNNIIRFKCNRTTGKYGAYHPHYVPITIIDQQSTLEATTQKVPQFVLRGRILLCKIEKECDDSKVLELNVRNPKYDV